MPLTPPSLSRRLLRRAVGLGAAVAVAAAGLIAAGSGSAGAASYQQGFDVSHYQGTVNWSSAYSKGARFAYMKASEGTNYLDPTFSTNYSGSYNAGFIRGAYHFARPNESSGTTQANYFVAHGGGWSADGKTLPPMLDIEYGSSSYGGTCYGLSQSSMITWIKAFNTTMLAKTHKYPMIYTTLDWWTQCTGNTNAFAKTNPFNIAKYSSTQPTPPSGTPFWTMWQYADSGTFPGDQDYFNGTYAMLQNLAKNADS